MEQVAVLAKVSLAAIQIYMNGICFSTCRYERMGHHGYWIQSHQVCGCVSYLKPKDSFDALKLEPTLHKVTVTGDKAEELQQTESPSYLKPYQYGED